ncbi:MAG: hypothetical protein Q9219_004343 [cf. Caloplaca sp. 3 TL-2023]
MDPFSTVGLLANIEGLAEGAFKLVSLVNTIKQGGKQRVRLFTELNSLWTVLKLLESHFDPEEQEISEQWLDTIKVLDQKDGAFDQISTVFDDLTSRLQPRIGHRKMMQTLCWPFDKSEVNNLIVHLERLKSTVSLAYSSTNAAAVRDIQGDTKYIKLSMAHEETKAITDWISNLNFFKQQVAFVSQVREGTGQWFLQDPIFQQWATSQESMLWCPGIMGVGKTYIASLAVDYLKNTYKDQNAAVLVLYCVYNEVQSQTVENLVAALIKQILQIRPDVSETLRRIHRESSRTDVPPKIGQLTSILRAELARFDNCFIVIDGLDEILDELDRHILLETLSYGRVNMMVTSRPLESIKKLFNPDLNGSFVECDGCDKKNPRVIFHCQQCLGEGYDLCEECHDKGIRCSKDGHDLVKTFGGLELGINATSTDIHNYVEWRMENESKLRGIIHKKRFLREDISSIVVQQADGV